MYFCEAKIWDFEWKGLISRHTDRSPRLTAKNGALSRLGKWRCRSGRLSIYHLSPCSNPPLMPRPLILPPPIIRLPSTLCIMRNIDTTTSQRGGPLHRSKKHTTATTRILTKFDAVLSRKPAVRSQKPIVRDLVFFAILFGAANKNFFFVAVCGIDGGLRV